MTGCPARGPSSALAVAESHNGICCVDDGDNTLELLHRAPAAAAGQGVASWAAVSSRSSLGGSDGSRSSRVMFGSWLKLECSCRSQV